MSSCFDPRSAQDILDLIRDYPLAWVVSHDAADFSATPLPLLAETNEAGQLVSLFGHLARSNPHHAVLERNADALILFQGPHGYISPKHGQSPGWGPTWNYAVARFTVRITLVPEENHAALTQLVDRMEAACGGNWTIEKMGSRYEQLRHHIVAFRAEILSSHIIFKLGQDEKQENFEAIVNGLDDRALAEWMMGQAAPADDKRVASL